MSDIQFETREDGIRLAFREGGGEDHARCGFFWLGGFKSDMSGSKAEAIAGLANATMRPCLRFDYSGHGQSDGLFTDGTISAWLDEARHFFEKSGPGRRIVIGSSMGGWLALLLLRRLMIEDAAQARRIAGLVLVAPAADMTADLMWDGFSPRIRAELAETGLHLRPSLYGEPYPITMALIDDGRRHLMLHKGLDCPCPLRILQGDADPDVPATHAVRLFEILRGEDITLTLIKGGDHRLSQPAQLALMCDTALRLAEQADEISA